jgi:macrolide-specific efflux system membrane fusion protein
MNVVVKRSVLAAAVFAVGFGMLASGCGKSAAKAGGQKVKVQRGDIRQVVQATGQVEPLNKVAILPPVTGRIDKIVVYEGAEVRRGQVLAWMSSSDRAAIMDNARSQGPDVLKKWEEEYKSTPIVAPTDGVIIARNIVEGQTVAADTDMYDLSDRLIVYADVDETDLGKIHMDQVAECTVEAYPNKIFETRVSLIGHQAIKVNNVISYQINLEPKKIPGELRAGMTADVNFIVQQKSDVLWIPNFAVKGQQEGPAKVKVLTAVGKEPEERQIQLGISDGVKVEVVSGLNEGDTVVLSAFELPKAVSGGPMSMSGGGRSGSGGGGGH